MTEIPKVKGYIGGNRTHINNFMEIVDYLNTNSFTLRNYLRIELGIQSFMFFNTLVLLDKVPSSKINIALSKFEGGNEESAAPLPRM